MLVDFDRFETNEFHAFDDASNAAAAGDVTGGVPGVMVDSPGRLENAEKFGVESAARPPGKANAGP